MMKEMQSINRRQMILVTISGCSLAGCLGAKSEQPGVVEGSDVEVQTNGSEELQAVSVTKDENNRGLEISTNDSVTDGRIIGEIPATIPDVSASSVYLNIDVAKLDDDAEVEFRFLLSRSGHRSAYIGNEFKNMDNGVIATETGTGYEYRSRFAELPGTGIPDENKKNDLSSILISISDGDFRGTIWELGFIFDDWTIGIL